MKAIKYFLYLENLLLPQLLKMTFGNCKHCMEWLFLGENGEKTPFIFDQKFNVRNAWWFLFLGRLSLELVLDSKVNTW